jgi:hypothetical protein
VYQPEHRTTTMNFLKKTANQISNGIELETLKLERGNLKNQIKNIEHKIEDHNKTNELKNHLELLLSQLKQSMETPIILSGSIVTGSTNSIKDDDSDDGVEYVDDPDGFASIQKKAYISIKSNYDEMQTIIEKLNIILAIGIDKYNAEIDKKRHRIEEINKRLSKLRGKK